MAFFHGESATRISFRPQSSLLASVSMAIIAVSMTPVSALAQEGTQGAASGDIVVTANRRTEDLTSIPYNISAIGGETLARTNTTSLESLANQVPGFSLQDRGPRQAANNVPIIRGLNASDTTRTYQVLEQSPVSTYLGNSLLSGYIPVDDIQRVEVLRGPQGTLYGGGSLGGTIRLIPNSPKLGETSGKVSASGSLGSHSDDFSYTTSGIFNFPIGDEVAVRLGAKYDHQAGFIDWFNVMKRESGAIGAAPVLADPSDVINSPAVYYNKKDANYANVLTARGAIRYEPSAEFNMEFSLNYLKLKGRGGPVANPTYDGGASPIDPRITYPDTGDYELVQNSLSPYSRTSWMGAFDLSYDFGPATISATTSYFKTKGVTANDDTFGQAFILPPEIRAFYTGEPINPRYLVISGGLDNSKTFTQEIRFVSKPGETFDYVVGGFYTNEKRRFTNAVYQPGVQAYSEALVAAGGNIIFGEPFVTHEFANGLIIDNSAQQNFEEKSIYGELTWHVLEGWDITGGARAFWQDFSQRLLYLDSVFGSNIGTTTQSSVNDQIFKLNTTYEFMPNHRVYATWSQGFRRGGANSFAPDGPYKEPDSLLTYRPDKANNYEVGIKGRFAGGLRYSMDLFYIDWKDTQIAVTVPNGWSVVANAPKARSKGFEAEVTTPLFDPALTLSASYAYIDAALTRDFCVDVGDSAGGVIPCGISGASGTRLPGSPRHSAAATLTYVQQLPGDASVSYTLNGTYKSRIANALPAVNQTELPVAPAYVMFNANISVESGPFQIDVFATNLLDKRAIYAVDTRSIPFLGDLKRQETISRPREVGLRLTYNF